MRNVLNRDTVAGKDIDENEKVCDTLNVKEYLFSEEEVATVIKGIKNSKAPGADSMINEFLLYETLGLANGRPQTIQMQSLSLTWFLTAFRRESSF